MDRLEHEIKNRLAQSGTREGVDSEALWNAISEASYPAQALGKKNRFGFIWLLLAAGVVVSILTFLISNESSSAYFLSLKHEVGQLSPANSNETQQHTSLAPSPALHPSAVSVLAISEERSAASYISEENTNLAINKVGEQMGAIQYQTDLSGKSSNSSSPVGEAASSRQENLKSLSEDKNSPQLSFREELNESDGSNEELFNEFIADDAPIQGLRPLNGSQFSIFPSLSKSLILKTSVLPAAAEKESISWEIYGGAVLLKNKFKNGAPSFADALNTSLSTEIGYSIGGLVRIKEGKNWNVSAGIEYMEWKDRFDKILFSDTLLWFNQGEVLAQNIRTIKHFNKASIITLPIQFELYKDIKRFRLAMNLGASYSLILSQNGRLLEDDFTVVNYSQSNKRFANFISARFAPSVGFKLNDKVLLDASCNIGIQRHGTSPINQLRSNSLALLPSVGLSFNY